MAMRSVSEAVGSEVGKPSSMSETSIVLVAGKVVLLLSAVRWFTK